MASWRPAMIVWMGSCMMNVRRLLLERRPRRLGVVIACALAASGGAFLAGCSAATAPIAVTGTYVLTSTNTGGLPLVIYSMYATGVQSETHAITASTITLDDSSNSLTNRTTVRYTVTNLAHIPPDSVVSDSVRLWFDSYTRNGDTITPSQPTENVFGTAEQVQLQGNLLVVTIGTTTLTYTKQ